MAKNMYRHLLVPDTLFETFPPSPFYEDVASADPLGVDDAMKDLPSLNEEGNVPVIAELVACSVDNSACIKNPGPVEAMASLRDMDILASSLMKHGPNPLSTVNGLEDEFIRMGQLTSSLPRMTVYGYAVGNPRYERRRSFTGSEQEGVFIDALALGVTALDGAFERMAEVDLKCEGKGLEAALSQATKGLEATKYAMVDVIRKITPEFFTSQIKPYFEPFIIDGSVVDAANGAQMPLTPIDQMLWGCDDDDPDYQEYFAHNSASLSQSQLQSLENFTRHSGGKSITSWLVEHRDERQVAVRSAIEILKTTRKFRYPHRQTARRNFGLRPRGSTGSGSYDVAILDTLIEKTENAISRLENSNYSK